MKEAVINISGMSCMHCVKAVKIGLEEAGLKEYNVEIGKAELKVDNDEELGKAKAAIEEAGYKVTSVSEK
ncbi:MAG: cation transporter [Ignavibacteriaceae bacterium]|nr:cation transporter [Ignavibacteriaceae bacterium]NUM69573.1 cation transporter [Ignavibacteriaceae bacterium]